MRTTDVNGIAPRTIDAGQVACCRACDPMRKAFPLAKRNVGGGCYGANAPGNRAPGYSLAQREVLPYDRRVKIAMSVTLAPELPGRGGGSRRGSGPPTGTTHGARPHGKRPRHDRAHP